MRLKLTKARLVLVRVTLAIAWFTVAVGWALMFRKVESVLIAAPVLCLFASILMALAVAYRLRAVGRIAAAHWGICLLFVCLVNLLDWSPNEAELPFKIMAALYGLLMLPLSLRCASALRLPPAEAECETCGYLLYGLVEPRCPECGTPFDRERLLAAPPREMKA